MEINPIAPDMPGDLDGRKSENQSVSSAVTRAVHDVPPFRAISANEREFDSDSPADVREIDGDSAAAGKMEEKTVLDRAVADGSVPMVASATGPPDLNVLDAVPESEPQVLIDARKLNWDDDGSKNQLLNKGLDAAKAIESPPFPNQPRYASDGLPPTIANVQHMLDQYGISARYNVIKKKLEIRLPDKGGTADNADNTAMTTIMSLATLNRMQAAPVPAIVEVIGDRNPYNPVARWILKTPWDGIKRVQAICDTLRTREGFPAHLKIVLVYKWLLSTVAAALQPSGFKGRGVLVLQGPQGIGKTSWVMSLVPVPSLRDKVVKVDHHLDANSKDSILGAITHWLVEIGELDSSFRKDFARLKGVLTSDSDKVRRPYARTESEYQRRTVFAATVNDENFLVDHTGNTRWWTLPLVSIDFNHGIDMQQLLAELAWDWANGKQWWLTKEEEALLESCNSDHRTNSVIRDLLLGIIDLDKKNAPGNPYKSTSELFVMLGITNPKNGDSKELTGILRELLGDSKKVKGIQKWRIPMRKGDKLGRDLLGHRVVR
ncbi:hypothetical protein HZ993_09320 [Rhodoferax sp. AJA081-3]|uniref:VapE domain-containing protein n=1 Tax=Rhodoferax sp. AJA081-3 TaxID=2752316 RepID=UPI001ADFCAF2|nr:VapE domain-containing protein [Rhodoferax sp. AJA081-3]QTN29980.1 hypothetical protein HZ993_09320 [Rhodoferax sp. AJA081-3]